jgi:hypothetical protein
MKPAGAPPKGPYPCGTNPPRPSRSVDWSEEANASAWAQEIGKAVDTDLLTSASQSPATTGLGAAGTHGPKGQAAFSCGRPINRRPNRTRRQRGRRG